MQMQTQREPLFQSSLVMLVLPMFAFQSLKLPTISVSNKNRRKTASETLVYLRCHRVLGAIKKMKLVYRV